MNLFLQRLSIENFKGIKSAAYDFGDVTHIFGQNATGKSSLVDAFCWLLFNKDSHGNAPGSDKFREKPLDDEGREIHYLDTTVQADFILDGQPFVLKRTQRENWVKKRGSAEATYQGNNSTYWINSVETKSSDFAARVNGIANGDVFLLITTLGAFNAMEWKKRRAMLVSMCGIDVDAELLSRPEYAAINEELSKINVSVDDLRKVLSDRKRDIAKELTTVPARIDEARRMRPEYTENDMREAEFNIRDAQNDLDRCDALIAQINAGSDGGSANINSQILAAESEVISIKRRLSDEYEAGKRRLQSAVEDATRRMKSAMQTQRSASILAADAKTKSSDSSKALVAMREEYKAVHAQTFTHPEVQTVCPTCGQDIPQEKVEETIAAARTAFEAERAARLAEINRRGQELKKQDAAYKEADTAAAAALEQADADFVAATEERDKAQQELSNYPVLPDYDENPAVKEAMERLHALRRQKSETPDEKLRQLESRREDLKARIDRAKAVLTKKETAAQVDKRIAELEQLQADLGQRRADAEVLLYDVERFITDRCALLEESINDRFPTIRWKLFDRQINGAIVDCCECMIPGSNALVSYGGTNTAASVNADIEIIGVLSKHYGITAPVFVDNAERVNYVAKPAGQLITLSVSSDKALRIDTNTKKEAA